MSEEITFFVSAIVILSGALGVVFGLATPKLITALTENLTIERPELVCSEVQGAVDPAAFELEAGKWRSLDDGGVGSDCCMRHPSPGTSSGPSSARASEPFSPFAQAGQSVSPSESRYATG